MKTREFQLDKLARARELQDEAAALHIPVPVMSWQFEVKDKDGNITEKGIGKANSYTRNGLNLLSWCAGCAAYATASTSAFGDGIMSYKTYLNATVSPTSYAGRYTGSNDAILYCGISSAAESLESYEIPASGLTAVGTTVSSSFNSTTRKLITVISRAFYNGTASAIDIVESGLSQNMTSGTNYTILIVRDVFAAVTVAAGSTLSWTYVIEVAYPNP